MCLTCTLVVISMGYVLSVIQTFPAPVVSSTNLMPISFSIPLVFSPSNSIPMCTLRVQFHSHLLRKNVWSNLFVCSMAMNNKVWIVTPKYVPAGWNPQVMAAPKLWCQSARLHAPVVLLMLAKQLSDWCDRATAQQGAIDFEKSLLGVRCDGSKTIWMEPTHAFPVGWCAVRTPHKGCVETHFHTTTISIFSNTISNNFNYPTCLHLSSCWLWRWHDSLSWLVLKCTIPGNKPWEILDDGCGLKDPSFKCSKVLPSCHDGQMEDIDSNCVFQVLKAQVKKSQGFHGAQTKQGFKESCYHVGWRQCGMRSRPDFSSPRTLVAEKCGLIPIFLK